MRISTFATVAIGAGLVACADGGPESGVVVTSLTRNVYVGADIEKVLLAQTPEEVIAKVEEVYQELLATKIEERAEALAGEIKEIRPHVVGLQEISLIRYQSPGDAVMGGSVPATEVLFDYLDLILDELAALGERYEVAVQVQNFDVEMPRGNDTFDDVRLTDFDVLLVRDDATFANVRTGSYATFLNVPVATGAMVAIRRGWVAADVAVGGVTFRVVNTHLESATSAVRLAQGVELIGELAGEAGPLILVGDLNSDAAAGADPTYGKFIEAGFVDAWGLAGSGPGFSCCHDPDLKNASPALTQRIDFVLLRHDKQPFEVAAGLVGDQSADRTASGLWPSDHAGVWATINFRR